MGISKVPVIITHSAPFSTVVDLYTTSADAVTSYQSEVTLYGMKKQQQFVLYAWQLLTLLI